MKAKVQGFTEGPKALSYTIKVLNGQGGWLPSTSLTGYSSLGSPEKTEAFRILLGQLVDEWLRCEKTILPQNSRVEASLYGDPDELQGHDLRIEGVRYFAPTSKPNFLQAKQRTFDGSHPANNSWLWRSYWDYIKRAQPRIDFEADGQVLITYMPGLDMRPREPFELPPFLNQDSALLNQWYEALNWFVVLQNSGSAHLLDKCVFCGKYFARKRNKGRSGPVTCDAEECRSQGSAKSTEKRRDVARARMLDVAAQAWASFKKSHRTPDRFSWVADRVNAQCREEIRETTRQEEIQERWVSRNRKEIEAMANEFTGAPS